MRDLCHMGGAVNWWNLLCALCVPLFFKRRVRRKGVLLVCFGAPTDLFPFGLAPLVLACSELLLLPFSHLRFVEINVVKNYQFGSWAIPFIQSHSLVQKITSQNNTSLT